MKRYICLIILVFASLGVLAQANTADSVAATHDSRSDNVSILSDSFYMPQLDRYRRIWIYLPPGYNSDSISYPVLYMHDGQNVFDANTSFLGEWNVDEILDTAISNGSIPIIVIGIDNGGMLREEEYTPWKYKSRSGGKGDLYVRFLIETLKPYVDSHYRTLPDRENTGMMGSSLGAIISNYSVIAYPEVFGKAGVFSPSFWYSDSCFVQAEESSVELSTSVYILIGAKEGIQNRQDASKMARILSGEGRSNRIQLSVVPKGKHNEELWRQNFEEAYRFLYMNE